MVLCREIGRQLIGVMADLVHGIAVLVIAGMGAFDVRYRLRQLCLLYTSRLKLRVKRQDSLTEITAVRPCPALVQHIAGTVQRKA